MVEKRPVIIFDGVCNLCNKSVDFILRKEKGDELMFTSNQSEAGHQILRAFNVPDSEVNTIYFLYEGKLYYKSAAALRIAKFLRFPWNLVQAGYILPRFLRDIMYDVIARNRYRWFGKRESCRLPTAAERARFL